MPSNESSAAQDRPMSGFTAHETLELLLGDFKWLLEQHPEHDGTYAQERVEQVEAVLRGD
jgi:hypothetical protein